jgi:hypothetical protein
MASKKQGTIRQLAESAGSPIDIVLVAGTVQVPQNFISGLNISLIDLLSHYEAVRAADRVPRSLCHDITNLSRVRRRSGKALN